MNLKNKKLSSVLSLFSGSRWISFVESVFDFFSSLKLAVITIVLLAVISSVGTVYESMYDRIYAQKLIYHSIWMWIVMALLAANITSVLFDRWPWKKHHIAFILAHVGILILLLGSVVTYIYGIDGIMVFKIGGSNRFVQLQDNEISVYTSMDGQTYRNLYQKPVNFFQEDFTPPLKIPLQGDSIEIYKYMHFALAEQKIVKSSSNLHVNQDLSPRHLNPRHLNLQSPAVQVLIEGRQASQSVWLYKEKMKSFNTVSLGPASFTLADLSYQRTAPNELIFRVRKGERLYYEIYKKGKIQALTQGVWQTGQVIPTGWMDFKFRVLKFYPYAEKQWSYQSQSRPSKLTAPALRIRYKGKEYYLGHNQPLKIFENDKVHIISYGAIRYDIGFDIKLLDFKVKSYQGTQKAMSYESVVEVERGGPPVVISMNQPMKKAGLTFYQSSFQKDELGRPTHSVFSVNKDPGRWIKYLGSFLIFFGIIMLFYFKDIYREKYKKRVTGSPLG